MNQTNFKIFKNKSQEIKKSLKIIVDAVGLIKRKRKIVCGLTLIMAMLNKVIFKQSFQEFSIYANLHGYGDLSPSAWKKVFSKNNELKQIFHTLLKPRRAMYLKPIKKNMLINNFLLLDTTFLSQVGCEKMVYRIHTCYSLAKHKIIDVLVSDHHVAENVLNFNIIKNAVYLADRAYAKSAQMMALINNSAHFIMRFSPSQAIIYEDEKATKKYDLLKHLSNLESEQTLFSDKVYIKSENKIAKVRIVASRKNPDDFSKLDEKLKREANKNQRNLKESTLEFNHWTIIITSFTETVSDMNILNYYRYRWQIELNFKRFKSILGIHKLEKSSSKYAFSCIYLLLIFWILLEETIKSVIDIFISKKDLCKIFNIEKTKSFYNFSLWKITKLSYREFINAFLR